MAFGLRLGFSPSHLLIKFSNGILTGKPDLRILIVSSIPEHLNWFKTSESWKSIDD